MVVGIKYCLDAFCRDLIDINTGIDLGRINLAIALNKLKTKFPLSPYYCKLQYTMDYQTTIFLISCEHIWASFSVLAPHVSQTTIPESYVPFYSLLSTITISHQFYFYIRIEFCFQIIQDKYIECLIYSNKTFKMVSQYIYIIRKLIKFIIRSFLPVPNK